ncbi:J domain-containing protein [Ornithinibacillus halophilus]|uniref:Tetratricopeptide repeat-containing protein n=1 Tax=Ornithinibacillus halophilus TaxID=930117 RepID=A0A1M5HJI1_9BACI|nr:DnaJ domain-containing protein [Ornithinibacillus halophilus]SHG16116.1 Tetratricopeptide repeat-containing protein [Ornithinibacillus halophilus]
MTGNYYEILGVPEDATLPEIKKAYARKIRQYSNETHPEEFQLIREAFEVLRDPEKRDAYDRNGQVDGNYETFMQEVWGTINQEQFHSALDQIHGMEHAYSEDADFQFAKAICYFGLQDYQQSKRVLYQLVLKEPNHETYRAYLGLSYLNIGDHYNAKKQYKELIRMNPNESNYYLNLSQVYLNLNQFDEAMRLLENRLDSNSDTLDDYNIMTQLAFIYSELGNDFKKKKIIGRIRLLPRNEEEREALMDIIMRDCEGAHPNSPIARDLILTVDKLNTDNYPEINRWVRTYLKRYPEQTNQNYARQETAATTANTSRNYQQNDYSDEKDIGGSGFAAVIIGIILSIIATPIVGIIAGFVYYFYGKRILQAIGCLIVIVIVGLIILSGL